MDPKFGCKQCGKTYKWKPEFAGKKVKCKCGYVMTAPAAPAPAPAADEPDLDALYDLADAGQAAAAAAPAMIRCPACTGEMEPGTQVCPSCGFNLKTGKRAKAAAVASGAGGGSGRRASAGGGGGGGGASTAAIPAGGGGAAVATAPGSPLSAFQAYGAPRKGLQKDAENTGMMTEFVAPIVIIVVGLVCAVLHATMFAGVVVSIGDAMTRIGTQLVLSLVLMVIGGALCIQLGEIAFGSPGPAALKLAALALGPSSIANLMVAVPGVFQGMGAMIIAMSLAFGMYFIMCHYLFEWDMSEKWIVTFMALLICMLAVPVATQMIFGPGKSAVRNDDAFVKARQDMGRTKEAKAWLAESNGRLVGELARGLGVDMVNELYALGATDVQVQPEGPNAAEIHVKMPKDAKKRKSIVEYYNQFATQNKLAHCEDKGGKWMLLRYLPIADPPMDAF
jgi:hypothetical protein